MASTVESKLIRQSAEVGTIVTFRRRGEPVQNFDMFSRAWDEFPELQVTPKDEWIGRNLLSLQSMDRWELGVHIRGEVIGGIALADDPWDAHVGPCVSVFAQYVMPEYRLQQVSALLMRTALRIARDSGHRVIAFTHRKGDWRYETIYRSIMKSPKIDNSGAEAAQRAAAEAQRQANNLQKNFQTDLKTENITQVTPGNDGADILSDSSAKRRRQGSGLASQLGINV